MKIQSGPLCILVNTEGTPLVSNDVKLDGTKFVTTIIYLPFKQNSCQEEHR